MIGRVACTLGTLVLLAAQAMAQVDPRFSLDYYTHTKSWLNNGYPFDLAWKLENGNIEFLMTLEKTGEAAAWAGLGFCETNTIDDDPKVFAENCAYWIVAHMSDGTTNCFDMHDFDVHNFGSITAEADAEYNIVPNSCYSQLVGSKFSLIFARPEKTGDACTYMVGNKGPLKCDRDIDTSKPSTMFWAYQFGDCFDEFDCPEHDADAAVMDKFNWITDNIKPAVAAPTPAPAFSPLTEFRAKPIFYVEGPRSDTNRNLFSASWYVDQNKTSSVAGTERMIFELSSRTYGWLAIGIRAVDSDESKAHHATRMFIAWFDDNTGRVQLLDAYSTNDTIKPIINERSSDSAIEKDLLEGSASALGTRIRFAIRFKASSSLIELQNQAKNGDDCGGGEANEENRKRTVLAGDSTELINAKGPLYLPGGNVLLQWATSDEDGYIALNRTCPETMLPNQRWCIPPHLMLRRTNRGYQPFTLIEVESDGVRPGTGQWKPDQGEFSLVWEPIEDGTKYRFTMSGRSNGYISFGWRTDASDLQGFHVASDVYVGWIDGSGVAHVIDTWSDIQDIPSSQESQDIENVQGETSSGRITISFDRLVDTGDDKDLVVGSGDVLLQWALEDTMPTKSADCRYSDPGGYCYLLHVTSKGGAGVGVVDFSTFGATCEAPKEWYEILTVADWLTFAIVLLILIYSLQRCIVGCCCRGHDDTERDSRNRVKKDKNDVDLNVMGLDALRTYGGIDVDQMRGSVDRDAFEAYSKRITEVKDASGSENYSPIPTNPYAAAEFFQQRADPRDTNAYGAYAPMALRALPPPPLRIDHFKSSQPVLAADPNDPNLQLEEDPWGYNIHEDTPIVTDGHQAVVSSGAAPNGGEYGIIAARTPSSSSAGSGHGVYTRVEPLNSGVPMVGDMKYMAFPDGRITHLAPLALAQRDSAWRRFKSAFSRRVVGHISVGDILLAIGYVALHAIVAGVFPPTTLRSVATLLGYLATTNSLMVALPATRNSLLAFLLGMHFDRTIMFHRWIGRWVILLVFLHGLLYLFPEPLTADLENLANLWGLLSLIAGLVLYGTSIEKMRRFHFEKFYWFHYFYVPYYLFAALHSPEVVFYYVIAAAILFALDRLVRFFWGLWPRKTHQLLRKDGDIVMVEIPRHPLATYNVGSYVFVNFPTLSAFQWHPYTLSSGPNDEYIEMHIKGLGDHTNQLLEMANSRQSLWCRVDGPYGKFRFDHRRFAYCLFAVGGVGVTPAIAALKDVYRTHMSDKMRAKITQKNAARVVHLCWSVKTPAQFYWFADVVEKCVAKIAKYPNDYPRLVVDVYITGKVGEHWELNSYPELSNGAVLRQGVTIFHGRPDARKVMDSAASNMKRSNIECGLTISCGPSPLVSAFWDEAVRVTVKKKSKVVMLFHHETFDCKTD